MPNSDTWPRAVSVDTLSNMDTARSCDSVISVNSACSEDSMEHLSAEEKACLMYLEETIESLDLQEDSGFSNDEPDPTIRRIKPGGSQTASQPDICSNIVTALAESGRPSGANEDLCETENPTTSSSTTPDISDPDLPSHIPPDPTPAVSQPASGSATPVPAQDTVEPTPLTDGEPRSPSAITEPSAKREMDLSMIPPPSDFMDEPVAPPGQTESDNSSATSPSAPKPTINLEVLRRRVSEKNIPVSNQSAPVNPMSSSPTPMTTTPASPAPEEPIPASPAPEEPTPASPALEEPRPESPAPENLRPESPAPENPNLAGPAPVEPSIVSPALQEKSAPTVELPSTPSQPSSPLTAAPSLSEHKSPPSVAPKPKRLPPNIILKSHKSTGGHDTIVGHLSHSERLAMDPQKVHMEALRKLGLLKSEESNPVSPKTPQTRKSWAPASSPLSPAPLKSPPPSAPYSAGVHNMSVLLSPPASSTHARSEPLPDIIPVPAAFSDPVASLHDDVFDAAIDRGSPALDKKLLSSPGEGTRKSATLERSGLGLSSYMESMDKQQTPGQLRNSRQRPASMGGEKDFQKSVPPPSSSPESSQKLPRSQGISVVISPGEQGEESRRKALRKLGLLRD